MGYGQVHLEGAGPAKDIRAAHAALDKIGVPPGPLAVRVLTMLAEADSAPSH